MKALTLWQPWATALALGLKKYETRHWTTDYRGILAIHAAKKRMSKELIRFFKKELKELNLDLDNLLELAKKQSGYIVAVGELTNCLEIDVGLIKEQSLIELKLGDWQPSRFAWELKNLKSLSEPIAFSGNRKLTPVPPEVEKEIW